MRRLIYIALILVVFSLLLSSYNSIYKRYSSVPATECDVTNEVFLSGEELKYEISYNWGLIWLNAGHVTFKVEMADHKGIPCYKISGIGGTYPSYDWVYKVRDRFECWIDTVTMRPHRYIRDVKEGGRTFYNECFFNHDKNKAYCVTIEPKKTPRVDTVPFGSCSLDPLTMIYFSRNIDYSKYKYNDTIPISLFLDNKTYPLYIRYTGKDKYKYSDKKTFNCIKFRPLLVDGTIFKGGEEMNVWASDDGNKIPLYVEAPILVGSVKARVVSWKGMKTKVD